MQTSSSLQPLRLFSFVLSHSGMYWSSAVGTENRPWAQASCVTTDMEYYPVLWLPFSLCLIFLAFNLLTQRIVSSYNICSTLGGLAVLLTPPLVSSKKQILKNYSLILIKEELYFQTLHDKASLFKGLCLNWHLSLHVCHTAGDSDH